MRVRCRKANGGYVLEETLNYFSSRYQKYVTIYPGYWSDGATDAIDIDSMAWWVHDFLSDFGKFSDGSLCTNWQASTILHDILLSEGRWFRARTWWVATWLFGGGKARQNGMW